MFKLKIVSALIMGILLFQCSPSYGKEVEGLRCDCNKNASKQPQQSFDAPIKRADCINQSNRSNYKIANQHDYVTHEVMDTPRGKFHVWRHQINQINQIN